MLKIKDNIFIKNQNYIVAKIYNYFIAKTLTTMIYIFLYIVKSFFSFF